jgi:hypothetical protein
VPINKGRSGFEVFMWSDESGIGAKAVVEFPSEGRTLWSEFINDPIHKSKPAPEPLDSLAY